ncbi:MAG: tetratricopeptide repeat protein, partial [Planctomycetota bacterium]
MSGPTSTELIAAAKRHVAEGRLGEAADDYRSAATLAADDAEVHLAAGRAAFAAGRMDDAVELFETVTRLTPAHGRALINIGAIRNQQGRHKEAEKVLMKAITLEYGVAEGFYNLGIARRKLKRNKQALEAYREAVRLDPGFAEAHQNLGNTLLDLGRARAAAKAFRAALQIRPNFPKATAGLRKAENEFAAEQGPASVIDRIANPAGAERGKGKTKSYPPLTEAQRTKDRKQLRAITASLESTATAWGETLRGDLPAALSKLEHAIVGSTATRLTDAGEAFEEAVATAAVGSDAYRADSIRLRA